MIIPVPEEVTVKHLIADFLAREIVRGNFERFLNESGWKFKSQNEKLQELAMKEARRLVEAPWPTLEKGDSNDGTRSITTITERPGNGT